MHYYIKLISQIIKYLKHEETSTKTQFMCMDEEI